VLMKEKHLKMVGLFIGASLIYLIYFTEALTTPSSYLMQLIGVLLLIGTVVIAIQLLRRLK